MIEEALKKGIQIEIEMAVEDAIEKAKADLDRRIPEIVAGLSISIMKRVSMRTMGDELVINVRMDQPSH